MEIHKGIPTFYPKSVKEWRKWLTRNHGQEKGVWLILYNKNSEIASINMAEAVEQALCFGWIDSVANKRDDESRYQYFSPRKPKSNWSKINRERVKKMTDLGLMTPSGQATIDVAKKTGTWTALETVDNRTIPDDLQQAFNKNKKAFQHFQEFSPSSQRMILSWILLAKRPETRAKRIAETVRLAAQNVKAHHPK
jgi:uncharacterized protein YdeI (YjbR/CyaY-like superfamily)